MSALILWVLCKKVSGPSLLLFLPWALIWIYNDSLVAAPVYSDAHKWCYFPDMTTREVIVLKQMDGRPGARSVYCPHTSFDFLDQREGTLPRRSIETRLLAVFEE